MVVVVVVDGGDGMIGIISVLAFPSLTREYLLPALHAVAVRITHAALEGIGAWSRPARFRAIG